MASRSIVGLPLSEEYPLYRWTIRFSQNTLPCALTTAFHPGAKIALTIPLADTTSFSCPSLPLEPGSPFTWYQFVEQLPKELTFKTHSSKMQFVQVTVIRLDDFHAVRGDSKEGSKEAINRIVHQNCGLNVNLLNCARIEADEEPINDEEKL